MNKKTILISLICSFMVREVEVYLKDGRSMLLVPKDGN